MVIPSDTGWEPDGAGPVDQEPVVVLDAGALLLPLLGVGAVLMAAYMLEGKSAADDGDEIDEDVVTEETIPDDSDLDFDDYDEGDEFDDDEEEL